MIKKPSKNQKPPERFFEYLKIANTLLGRFLPSYSSCFEICKLQASKNIESEGEANRAAYDATQKILLLVIRAHPALCQYVFGKPPETEISSDEYMERIGIYEQVRVFSTALAHIVQRAAIAEETRPGEEINLGITSTQIASTLNADGSLTHRAFDYDIFEGVNLRRFKFCPVCEEIFWLSRSDKQACDKCSNAYRQKTYQNKNRAELNKKQREAYKQNKKLKKMKEGKNGTL